MTTNNKTFASRAKAIIRKYKHASFDPIQKKELEAELDKLAQEQEAYKQANGIGVQPQPTEQPQQFWRGGPFGKGFVAEPIPADDVASAIHSYIEPSLKSFNVKNPELKDLNLQTDLQTDNSVPYSTSIAPALLSGATSLIGNLVMGQIAGKRKVNYATLKPTQVSAEQVSLANERNQIARKANIASRVGMRNAATSARTRGEYMGNVGNMVVGLNQNVADAYSKSYQTEQLTNAQARQQAAQFNAQNKMAVDQYNNNIKNSAYQQQLTNKAEQADYISAAIESIPSTMQNIEQIKQFDAGLAVSTPQNYQLVKTPTNKKAYEFWKKKYNVGLQYKKQ